MLQTAKRTGLNTTAENIWKPRALETMHCCDSMQRGKNGSDASVSPIKHPGSTAHLWVSWGRSGRNRQRFCFSSVNPWFSLVCNTQSQKNSYFESSFWKLQELWCLQNDEMPYLSGSGSLCVTIKTKWKATGLPRWHTLSRIKKSLHSFGSSSRPTTILSWNVLLHRA